MVARPSRRFRRAKCNGINRSSPERTSRNPTGVNGNNLCNRNTAPCSLRQPIKASCSTEVVEVTAAAAAEAAGGR